MDPDAVKPRRRYDAPRRRERTAATRRGILDAAARLFEDRGYAATTIAAIASEAGVGTRTVHVAFATKAGLLHEVWNLRLRGEDDGVPMPRRPWYVTLLAEPDPGLRLDRMARVSREVKERAGGMLEVIRSAATVDPDAAGLWERIGTEFHGLLGGVVATIDRDAALRPGLGPDAATDLLWTLTHPDLWHLLVTGRGWPPARYEAWLAGALRREILGRDPAAAVSSPSWT